MTVAPHRLPIQLRFVDTDALGHVNNASFAKFVELARIDLMVGAGLRRGTLILARLTLDFRRQVYFGDAVEVTTEVVRTGRTSVTLRHLVMAENEVAAEATSVVVHFDYQAQRPQPLTPAIRERLQAFTAPD
jgi:acyl-CoA thioester hydrolase